MLVLSRKIGEEIVIGRVTCVRIVRMCGNRVFLAIEEPSTVSIDRKEIWLAKERERLPAGNGERAMVTGPDRTRQGTLDYVAGRDRAPVDDSIVRKAIPMLKRGTTKDRPEENRAERYDHRRILRLGIPLGSQSEAAGFRAALVRLLADSQVGDGPTIEFCNDLTTDTLRAELQSAVLAIVLELLHNACRHSKSADILLGITRDDECLCVQVEDWGVGFDVQREQSRGLGLKGIRHLVRWLGGTIEIDSQLGRGTCVIVEVPLPQETGTNHPSTGLKPR